MAKHARLSPSAAHRWIPCTGSVALVDALPPSPSSEYADEGTFCHAVAADCLNYGSRAAGMIGFKSEVNGRVFTLDEEQARCIDTYVDAVREFAQGRHIMFELSLQIDNITGEDGARGTADAIVLVGDELQVHDLKMGRGVEVEAEDNYQLMMYALAALEQFSPVAVIRSIRGFIHQPRLSADPKIATWTPRQLEEFGSKAARASVAILTGSTSLVPGEKQCRFCPAKATCPALAAKVQKETAAKFDTLSDEDELAEAMKNVDLIEQWCKDVRAEVERRLLAGKPVPGFKLVEGRRGNRAWSDPKEVEQLLTQAVGDRAYTKELISVAVAEKVLKAGGYEQTWAKRVLPLIKQAPGRPSVAPEGDKRPALAGPISADAFD